MCYPKPGPRCTPHAKDYLEKAKTRLESALIAESKKPSANTKDRLVKAFDNFCERQSDYDTTPEGILALAKYYQQNKGTAQEDVYKRRLSYAKAKQEHQAEWASEYSQLNKAGKKTSQKMVVIKKKIEAVNEAIVQDKHMYESALSPQERRSMNDTTPENKTSTETHIPTEQNESQLETTPRESKSWQPTATQQKREAPTELQETSSKKNEKLDEEVPLETKNLRVGSQDTSFDDYLANTKRSVVKIDSFDSLTSDKPLRGSIASYGDPSLEDLSPKKKIHYSELSSNNRPNTYPSQEKPEGSLMDMMGNYVSTHVVDTPNGVAWIIQQDDTIRTIKVPANLSENKKKSYYARLGLVEVG